MNFFIYSVAHIEVEYLNITTKTFFPQFRISLCFRIHFFPRPQWCLALIGEKKILQIFTLFFPVFNLPSIDAQNRMFYASIKLQFMFRQNEKRIFSNFFFSPPINACKHLKTHCTLCTSAHMII